ncbi:MAG: hypothetical protein LUH04_14960, partial [Clostridium sp.]|nr:hypothetical protein [Clostridium sp.]
MRKANECQIIETENSMAPVILNERSVIMTNAICFHGKAEDDEKMEEKSSVMQTMPEGQYSAPMGYSPCTQKQVYPNQYPMDARLSGSFFANTYPMQPNYAYYNQQGIDLARKADLAAIEVGKTAQKERILTEAISERKARLLDLQVRHANRQVEMRLDFDGVPVIHREMLAQNGLEKKIANISQCRSVLYMPDVCKQCEKTFQILGVRYRNDSSREMDGFFIDPGDIAESAFLKMLRAKGVKLLCGRRQQIEYAGKLLDGL